jgi:hypothetical protein
VIHIDRGRFDDVKLDSLNFAIIADWFRVSDGFSYEYSGTDAAVAPVWRGP